MFLSAKSNRISWDPLSHRSWATSRVFGGAVLLQAVDAQRGSAFSAQPKAALHAGLGGLCTGTLTIYDCLVLSFFFSVMLSIRFWERCQSQLTSIFRKAWNYLLPTGWLAAKLLLKNVSFACRFRLMKAFYGLVNIDHRLSSESVLSSLVTFDEWDMFHWVLLWFSMALAGGIWNPRPY